MFPEITVGSTVSYFDSNGDYSRGTVTEVRPHRIFLRAATGGLVSRTRSDLTLIASNLREEEEAPARNKFLLGDRIKAKGISGTIGVVIAQLGEGRVLIREVRTGLERGVSECDYKLLHSPATEKARPPHVMQELLDAMDAQKAALVAEKKAIDEKLGVLKKARLLVWEYR